PWDRLESQLDVKLMFWHTVGPIWRADLSLTGAGPASRAGFLFGGLHFLPGALSSFFLGARGALLRSEGFTRLNHSFAFGGRNAGLVPRHQLHELTQTT